MEFVHTLFLHLLYLHLNSLYDLFFIIFEDFFQSFLIFCTRALKRANRSLFYHGRTLTSNLSLPCLFKSFKKEPISPYFCGVTGCTFNSFIPSFNVIASVVNLFQLTCAASKIGFKNLNLF